MDNPGTLPIYAYNNAVVPEFPAITDELADVPPAIPDVTQDEITVQIQQTTRTSSGRRSRKRNDPDSIYF